MRVGKDRALPFPPGSRLGGFFFLDGSTHLDSVRRLVLAALFSRPRPRARPHDGELALAEPRPEQVRPDAALGAHEGLVERRDCPRAFGRPGHQDVPYAVPRGGLQLVVPKTRGA